MTLVVFFTRGMSLTEWKRAGLLERELAIYRRLGAQVERLVFVTYGGPEDGDVVSDLKFEVLTNRWRIPANFYSVLAPWLHRRVLRGASVFRTNQLNGAWSAVFAKRLFGKPLIVRCGYLWSDNLSRQTSSRWRRALARFLERSAVRRADRVIVATERDAATLAGRYGVDRGRITVIPNYVDTAMFKRLADVRPEAGHVIFVGRLETEKNVGALIDAVAAIAGARLTLVGDGSLRGQLEQQARRRGANVAFLGRVPYPDLPALLNQAQVLVLPSHFEGNPKVIVEAMACGVPVVGTNVPGIADVITTGGNGILCGLTPGEIRDAVQLVAGDAALRDRLCAAGLEYVRTTCSLDAAAASERRVLATLESAA